MRVFELTMYNVYTLLSSDYLTGLMTRPFMNFLHCLPRLFCLQMSSRAGSSWGPRGTVVHEGGCGKSVMRTGQTWPQPAVELAQPRRSTHIAPCPSIASFISTLGYTILCHLQHHGVLQSSQGIIAQRKHVGGRRGRRHNRKSLASAMCWPLDRPNSSFRHVLRPLSALTRTAARS